MKTEILAFIEGMQVKYIRPDVLPTQIFNEELEVLKRFISRQKQYCDDIDMKKYMAEMARKYGENHGTAKPADNS